MSISKYTVNGRAYGVGQTGEVVREIQMALISAGHVLVPDGDFGPITESAVKQFQAAHGLAVDGYVGPLTAAKLDKAVEQDTSMDSVLNGAPWLSEMRAITGVREVPGSANSPIIMSWRQEIARAFPEQAAYASTYTGDSIPWCGYAVARCMAVRGIKPPFGSSPTSRWMWADAWSRWGEKLSQPIVGCVMTFTRSGGGHVALLERLDGNVAYIRGGNQSDMVNVVRKSMSSFTAARWPSGWKQAKVPGNISNAVDESSFA